MAESSDVQKISKFIVSDEFREFVRVCEQRPPNIFRVAGIADREVYLTKVVAWLLTPGESHHLGAEPLRRLLLRAASRASGYSLIAHVLGADLTYSLVTTGRWINQHRRLDIVVECQQARLLVVLENKIRA
jgi:hypothetical protein